MKQKSMLLKALLLPFLVLQSFRWNGEATLPTDNPLRGSSITRPAWTDKIPWDRAVNAATVPGLIDPLRHVDSTIFSSVQKNLVKKGGGVVFFPSGEFFFSTDLPLAENIIIRGVSPTPAMQRSGGVIFPQTRFTFPRLLLKKELQRFAEGKVPDTVCTQPRSIYNIGAHGVFTGIADVDIDRAVILLGYQKDGADSSGRLIPRIRPVENILLWNVRQNNAAALDPGIPTPMQRENGRDWQIWPDSTVGNMNLRYGSGLFIQGCTLNDSTTDNILQNDYMLNDHMELDGSLAKFNFDKHPGIVITGPATATPGDDNAVSIVHNSIGVSPGFMAIMAANCSPRQENNHLESIPDKRNLVRDGRIATDNRYDLLYDGRYPSQALLYTDHLGDSMPYRLIEPESYDSSKSYPLVVYLHDFWSKGNDNRAQLRPFLWQLVDTPTRTRFPCFIIAPQLPVEEPRWKCGGLGSETWPLRCTVDIISEISKQYNIDPKRIYVIGNSMGGAGALNIATHYPELFAGVVSIGVFYRLTDNAARQLRHTPLWIMYGSNEERIKPQIRTEIKAYLKLANVPLKFTEVDGYGHRCWLDIVKDEPTLLPWLFDQKLN